MALDTKARTGAWMLAAAGAIWAYGSAQAGDFTEVIWCSSVAVGFALVGVDRRWALVVGSAVATLGPTYWLTDAIRTGRGASPWIEYGVGVDVAALLAIAVSLGARQIPIASRAAFALIAIAGASMLVADPTWTIWAVANALTLAGGALLSWRTPLAGARKGLVGAGEQGVSPPRDE